MTPITRIISITAKHVVDDFGEMGIPLDGSEASLKTLDDAVELLWREAQPSDEYFDGMVWGYGCYVADVIQRHITGEWKPSDNIGYDFHIGNVAAPVNPWVWVEKRFLLNDLLAPKYGSITPMARRGGMLEAKDTLVINIAPKTNVSIDGAGVSISFLAIDQESFRVLTQEGFTEPEYEALVGEVEDEGQHEEGLLIDDLKVAVNDKVFICSWSKIKGQLKDQCLLPQKLYEQVGRGEYLVVCEKRFVARWAEIDVENYSHDMLRFNVESVEPSKEQGYLLMDFTFNADALTYSSTYSEDTVAYIVDRQGNRHTIKLNYEW